jgi:predicted glycosyltransferase
MKILIDVNHPSQVHLFKNAVWEWQTRGHDVLIVARDKDVTLELLEQYKLNYLPGTTRKPGILNLIGELIRKTILITRISKKFNPDILLSLGSPPAAWAAFLLGKPHIAFTDTEHSVEQLYLYKPFSVRIYTPDCFLRDLGKKHFRYAGYHELAYLHPARFTPSSVNLEKIGLSTLEPYFVLRLVSFDASHDINHKGLTQNEKASLLKLLGKYGRIVVSSEAEKAMKIQGTEKIIPPAEMHDLLAFASLLVGEGTHTMATEAALLGTPAITLTSHTGGNLQELEDKYGLVKVINNPEVLEKQIQQLLESPNLKQSWMEKRQKLLNDKIDVTAFIVEEVINFVNARGNSDRHVS